jgi:hypothetical protein
VPAVWDATGSSIIAPSKANSWDRHEHTDYAAHVQRHDS